MIRVLITVYPLMYREALAAAVRQARPGAEVYIAAPEDTRGEVERLRPHLLVHTDQNGVPGEVLKNVPRVARVLYDDSMGLTIGTGGGSPRKLPDASIGVLLEAVDDAAASSTASPDGGPPAGPVPL